MTKYFKLLYSRQKSFWNKGKLFSFLWGLLFIAAALLVQKAADAYVGDIRGVYVPDLLLDKLPTVDMDFFIIQGSLILTFVAVALVAVKPQYLIFALKSFALFIVVRSVFISLTHLGVSPRELPFDVNSFGFSLYNWLYNTSGDFFFSGHTGAPFLFALIFWKEKFWRRFFLASSFVFGVSVLLAHIHYSIDVLAAPFMTYGIYAMARHFFKKDFEWAQS